MLAKPLVLSLLALTASTQFPPCQAQTPTSRAEVKSETRAAQKAHQLVPPGQGSPQPAPGPRSTKTIADRKAEFLQARKAGELESAGEAEDLRAQRAENSRPSVVNRASRKAQTRAAEKAGALVPAGEGPGAPTK